MGWMHFFKLLVRSKVPCCFILFRVLVLLRSQANSYTFINEMLLS